MCASNTIYQRGELGLHNVVGLLHFDIKEGVDGPMPRLGMPLNRSVVMGSCFNGVSGKVTCTDTMLNFALTDVKSGEVGFDLGVTNYKLDGEVIEQGMWR